MGLRTYYKPDGRPVALNLVVAFRLGAAMGRGWSLERSAKYADIGIATLYRYLAAGRRGEEDFEDLVEAIDELRSSLRE
jgi:hypothetical protein